MRVWPCSVAVDTRPSLAPSPSSRTTLRLFGAPWMHLTSSLCEFRKTPIKPEGSPLTTWCIPQRLKNYIAKFITCLLDTPHIINWVLKPSFPGYFSFCRIDIIKYVIYGIASAFFVYGILLMVEGFFTSGAIKDLYGDFKITTCGRCVSAWVGTILHQDLDYIYSLSSFLFRYILPLQHKYEVRLFHRTQHSSKYYS